MTEYENPPPREDVNYSKEHPLKEFGQLLIGVAAVALLIVFVAHLVVSYAAPYIPFEYEQKMMAHIQIKDFIDEGEAEKTEELQKLADRLAKHMELPSDFKVTVHYSKSDTVNALATLGGNMIVFEGLLREMESEDELAAVIAHEIAHIKLRHPIKALGKGVTLGMLAAFIGGASGSATGEWLLGNSINIGLLKFSRDQEREADLEAAGAVQTVYGHIRGVEILFNRFDRLEKEHKTEASNWSEMFRSHPFSSDRWEGVKQQAVANGWGLDGQTTPL